MSKHRFYRPELDVLRCLAFLLVFLHHSALFTNRWLVDARIAGGFGLCLFFFLSAFLITELLDREQESTGTIRLRAFYARRILRIWPLYFAALLFDFIHARLHVSADFTVQRLAAYLFLAGNWFAERHGLVASLSLPLWSISVEEQFYVVWPSARRFLTRSGAMLFSLGALALAYIVLFRAAQQNADTDVHIWVDSFVQFQFFATGALLALSLRSRTPSLRAWHRPLLFTAGLAAFFCAQSVFQTKVGMARTEFRLVMPGYLLVNFGCIAIFLSFLGAASIERAKALVYLGKISYGLYVFHWMLLNYCGTILSRALPHLAQNSQPALWARATLALPATILVASISYRYFEKPILRYKQRFEVIRTRPA